MNEAEKVNYQRMAEQYYQQRMAEQTSGAKAIGDKANDKQVGGDHYVSTGEQHWDRVYRMHGRGYFIGCATKYAERYHLKNGKQDLEKAIHFLQKLIELEYPEGAEAQGNGYVNQDR